MWEFYVPNSISDTNHPIPDPDLSTTRTLRRLSTDATYLFANIATTLARADVEAIDAEVERSLQVVGRSIGADRVALCTSDGSRLATASQWVGRGGWMDAPISLELSKASYLRGELEARRPLIVSSLSKLPRSAHYERSAFSARDTEGVLIVPVSRAERCILVETFESHKWSGPEVALLESFSDAVAAALERKEYQQSLVAEAHLARTESARHANLFAMLAHELRTPLTGIVGYSDMLKAGAAGDLSERQSPYIEDILSSALHMAGLINDCLSLSRIDTGRPSMAMATIDPVAPMRDALRHVAPDAERARIELITDLPAESTSVRADHQKLVQLASNLLVNAVKFTPAGGKVTARVAISESTYSFEVHDTGVGIPERDQKKIFRLFAQTETGVASERGIGLGLALVQRIVSLHDGTITLHSRKGEGSRFTATLAREPSTHPDARAASLDAFETW
jgi:signal transduction histidine kinase